MLYQLVNPDSRFQVSTVCTGSGAGSSGIGRTTCTTVEKGNAVSVWSPHLQKDIDMLEKTQTFATRDWSYHELLAKLHLPTLTQRSLHIDLCLTYIIIHGLMYFHRRTL